VEELNQGGVLGEVGGSEYTKGSSFLRGVHIPRGVVSSGLQRKITALVRGKHSLDT